MGVPYNCDQSSEACNHYYQNQAAYGMPVYVGARHQKGNGFFSSLFRMAVPLLKRGAIGLSKHLLKAGTNIVSDVEAGQNFSQAAKRRMTETGEDVLSSLQNQMGGAAKRKKKINIKPKKPMKKLIRKKSKPAKGRINKKFSLAHINKKFSLF